MNNKEFYKIFIKIGLPIVLSQVLMSSLNFIDTLMIGSISEAAVAAVGAASRIFFIFIVCIFGIYSAGGIFTSQYWGVKNLKALHQILGIMMIFGMGLAVIMLILTLLFPVQIMSMFSDDALVISYGVDYLRILSPSFIFSAISFLYAYASRSIHMTQYPLYISMVSLSLNTFLNYILIHGYLGMPTLGVRGVAIATLIARVVEFILFIVLIFVLREHPLRARIDELFSFSKLQMINFIKKGTSVFLNESSWVIGQAVFYIAYGILGTQALSSVQVALTLADIFVSLFTGISTACGVMIGNALGRNEVDIAKNLAYRFTKISLIAAISVTVIMSGLAFLIPKVYTSFSVGTSHMAVITTLVIAMYQIPKMYNYVAVVGILRSGGDTFFCMLIDLIGVWGMGIPMAFYAAIVLKLPVYGVVAFAFSEEIIKSILYLLRIRRDKWMNNLI